MQAVVTKQDKRWSTSAWGSELKYWLNECHRTALRLPLREVVSWNDFSCLFSSLSQPSTSAWGSELKYIKRFLLRSVLRLPLREVVSWNAVQACLMDTPASSTSAWGSELKYYNGNYPGHNRPSTSAWGSELKCDCLVCFLLCVLSTSAWGSELKYSTEDTEKLKQSVYLCVR